VKSDVYGFLVAFCFTINVFAFDNHNVMHDKKYPLPLQLINANLFNTKQLVIAHTADDS